MKFRHTIILIFSLFCLLIASIAWAEVLPTAVPEQVGLSSQRLNRIDTVLDADINKGMIPGAVALVARKGKIAYFKSFGMRDKAKSLPMEKDSIFRVYSMTKPIVGAAAAILLEEGKFLLYDPVHKYIPSFKDVKVGQIKTDDAGKEVVTTVKSSNVMTIHDLFTRLPRLFM